MIQKENFLLPKIKARTAAASGQAAQWDLGISSIADLPTSKKNPALCQPNAACRATMGRINRTALP
ncbi:MAG: hypothetical protein ACM3WS_07400 [Bacillota bacterium]